MTTTYNQQLGPLRSEITFTLHTQYATRLWNGRDLVKNEAGEVVDRKSTRLNSSHRL